MCHKIDLFSTCNLLRIFRCYYIRTDCVIKYLRHVIVNYVDFYGDVVKTNHIETNEPKIDRGYGAHAGASSGKLRETC